MSCTYHVLLAIIDAISDAAAKLVAVAFFFICIMAASGNRVLLLAACLCMD